MKLKIIEVGKEFKCGLPEFSNITVHCNLSYELGEDEVPDWDKIWDEVNTQLSQQTSGIDPSWMKEKEYKRFFQLKIKIPKNEENR